MLKTIILVICFFNLSFSQDPILLWEETYSETGGSFYSIISVNDGNFVILRNTNTDYNSLQKIDNQGQIIWESANILGLNYFDSHNKNIVKHNNEFIYYISNNLNSSMTNHFSLSEINSSGTVTNQWHYPNAIENDLIITKLICTQDGGFLAIGSLNENGWITKIDIFKNIQWTRLLNNNLDLFGVIEASDGTLVVAGNIAENSNPSSSDFYMAKLSQNNNLIWERTYGSIEHEFANAVAELTNGNYLLVGGKVYNNNSGQAHVWSVATDSFGNQISETEITNNQFSYFQANIIPELNGGYTLGITSICNDETNSQSFIIKNFNTNHQTVWQYCGSRGNLLDIIKTNEGNYITIGEEYNSTTTSSLPKAMKIGWEPLSTPSFENRVSIYPNPAQDYIKIKNNFSENQTVVIYNVAGQTIMKQEINQNENSLDVTKLASGIYFVQLPNNNTTLKWIKE